VAGHLGAAFHTAETAHRAVATAATVLFNWVLRQIIHAKVKPGEVFFGGFVPRPANYSSGFFVKPATP
jgi:hypothetical protein